MTQPTTLALTCVAVLAAVAVLVLAVTLVRTRRRTAEALDRAAAQQEALLARLERLELAGAGGAREATAEFVITDVGEPGSVDAPAVPARIEGRLFADLVLRESVVKAASWAHGVRRVLAPEVRFRLRAEARRETRRSARQRRADVKEALRQYYARERGDVA